MASTALVVSRREESKTGLSDENGQEEVGFRRHLENPPVSQVHMPFKILARNPPRISAKPKILTRPVANNYLIFCDGTRTTPPSQVGKVNPL